MKFKRRNPNITTTTPADAVQQTLNHLHIARDDVYTNGRFNEAEFLRRSTPTITCEKKPYVVAITHPLTTTTAHFTIDKTLKQQKQRWQFAVMVGFYYLIGIEGKYQDDDKFYVYKGNVSWWSTRTKFANEFAANLLLPEHELKELLNADTKSTVISVAKHFNVTPTAAYVRIRRLKLWGRRT